MFFQRDNPIIAEIFPEVDPILDACLTKEIVNGLAVESLSSRDLSKEEFKRKLLVNLLEHSGRELNHSMKRELLPAEVMHVYERIRQFLAQWEKAK